MSPSEAMMELRSTTGKLNATVKTEHVAGPEHGWRLGWWFTVAQRFDYDSCDGEKRRLRSFRKWIHGVVRAWLIPVMARTKKNKTNRASRSQVTTNPFSRPQGPFAEESRSRPCVNETPREFRRPSSREEMGRGRVSSK